MSQAPEASSAPRRRPVPVWAQVLIWGGLVVALVILGLSVAHAQRTTLRVGTTVPDFRLTLYDHYGYQNASAVKLSDLRGKVVLVNFWASWCVPCASEAAELESAWRTYQPGGQVVFLGVDYVDTPAEALSYLDKFSVSYPNGPDLQTQISQIFNRNLGVPETYVIDKHGLLRSIQIGPFASAAAIQSLLDPLVAEK